MSRFQVLSDARWELIAGQLPKPTDRKGRPFADARLRVEGAIYRYRCGIAGRNLLEVFGLWQTIWIWHRRLAADGTLEKILAQLQAQADAEGLIDWTVSVDSTAARAHQHATDSLHTGASSNYTKPRVEPPDHAVGDIVLANNSTHGGIYVGDGQVISATSSGVSVYDMNTEWHQVNTIVRPA